MDIQISFQDGPIQAEIQANEEDDYKEVLEALSDFVEGYGSLSGIPQNGDNGAGGYEDGDAKDASLDSFNSDNPEGEMVQQKQENSRSQEPDNELLAETGLTEDQLYRILKVGEVDGNGVEVFPRIISDTSPLGDSIQQRLLHGSTVILTVLSDYHEVDRVKTSDLKQALKDSGMKSSNFGNIGKLQEEEVYLDRRGSGNSATTKIRPPGKDKAYELIQKLAE